MGDKLEIVYIEWIDAHGGAGQYNRDYVEESTIDYMYSAGVLLKETDEFITIVQDSFQATGDMPQVRDFESIPKANIKKIKKFRVA